MARKKDNHRSFVNGLIKFQLLLIFFGLFLPVYGQHEFASIQLSEKNIRDYVMVSDEEGNVSILFYKKPYLFFYIIDKNGEVLHQVKEPFKYNPSLLGATYNKNSYIFYYKPRSIKKEGDIAAFIIDKANGKFKGHENFFLKSDRNEELIGQLSNGKEFYVLIGSKSSKELKIAKLERDQPDIRSFQYPAPINQSIVINNSILYVDPSANKSIYNYQAANKAYLKDGKIYFTFDLPKQFKTYVWMINWKQAVSKLLKYPQKKLVFGSTSNSFLYDDKLLRITFDKARLDLSIFEIGSGLLIKNYSYTGEKPININKGPIYNEDETTGKFRTLPAIKNSKLFKALSNGTASIYVNKIDDDNVMLTIGTYNASSSGVSVGGALGSFGKVGGIVLGGSKQLSGTRQGSIYFKAFLTYPDLDISSHKNLTSISDRIQTYLLSHRIRISSARIYNYLENDLHLTYLDNRNGKLKIIEFSN